MLDMKFGFIGPELDRIARKDLEERLSKAVENAKTAKAEWLEKSLTGLTAKGYDGLAIEEHPDKTVITNHGIPVGEFRMTFVG